MLHRIDFYFLIGRHPPTSPRTDTLVPYTPLFRSIVRLVIPVCLPIVLKLPIEDIGLTDALVAAPSFVAVWYGILFCVNMQVSFLSPPFGPAAFYLKSVAPPHISLPDIFRGFLPFIVIQLLVLTMIQIGRAHV